MHVDSDRVQYEPGSTVRLDLRLLDLDYSPLSGGTISLELSAGFDPDKTERIERVKLITDEAGTASHEFEGLEPGVYRARAKATVRGKKITAQDIILVKYASAEDDRPAAETATLEAVAGASSGSLHKNAGSLPPGLTFTEPQIVRIDRRSDVELWSRPWLFGLALLFLGLEWALRQRSGSL